MAKYGSTTVNGYLDGNMQFLNQGYGLTGYPNYGGFDGDPVSGYAFIFLVKLGGSQGPIWLDTDLNKATGYNGYEYHVIWSASGAPLLYSGSLGQTLIGPLTDYAYVPSALDPTAQPALEFAISPTMIGGARSAFVTLTGTATSYITAPQAPGAVIGTYGGVTLDGSLGEWAQAQRIDTAAPNTAMDVYGRIDGNAMVFALHLKTGNFKSTTYTTLWLNTDFNTATGYSVPLYNISGSPTVQVGAEYNLRFDTAGHVLLEKGNTLWPAYSPNGAAVYSELIAPVPFAFSADYTSVEVAVPLSMLDAGAAGAKVHVQSSYGGGPALTADGYTVGTPPGGQTVPPVLSMVLLHDTGSSNADRITADPTLSGIGDPLASIRLTIDGAANAAVAVADASGKWAFAPAGLSQGAHTIIASETNAAGLTATATLSFFYDSIAPTVAVTSQGGSAASSSQTIAGTGEAGTQVMLFDGAAAIGAPVTVRADGTWSTSVILAGGQTHVLSAFDTDVAGNVGQSAPITLTVATQPPAFTGITRSSNGSATLTGTAQGATRVNVYDGTTRIGAATVAAGDTWSFITARNLSKTVHVFTATSTDAAGNAIGPSGSAQLGTGGADRLTSTTGSDVFLGGAGVDVFSFAAKFGKDIITDFAPSGSGHDIINFKGNPVLNSYAAVMSHATQAGRNVLISQDPDNVLTLANVSKSSLTSRDFTFV